MVVDVALKDYPRKGFCYKLVYTMNDHGENENC